MMSLFRAVTAKHGLGGGGLVGLKGVGGECVCPKKKRVTGKAGQESNHGVGSLKYSQLGSTILVFPS